MAGYQHFGGRWREHGPLKHWVSYQNVIWHHNPEDLNLNLCCCENFKFHFIEICSVVSEMKHADELTNNFVYAKNACTKH
jgi:hypothetical protein